MIPIRQLGSAVAHIAVDRVRPLCSEDFAEALQGIKPSVGLQQLKTFKNWTEEYGTV